MSCCCARSGINPIVVHGGGPQINRTLDRLGIKSNFVDGLRVTDARDDGSCRDGPRGSINNQIVTSINAEGGCAIGLTGKTAG